MTRSYRKRWIKNMSQEQLREYNNERNRLSRLRRGIPRPKVEKPEHWICNKCGKRFPFTNEYYYEGRGNKWGLSKRCKECGRRASRDFILRNSMGISLSEYEDLMNGQEGCQICGNPERLVLDHCHDTGKLRGIICDRCNQGIGMLGDCADYLEKALSYLRASEGRS